MNCSFRILIIFLIFFYSCSKPIPSEYDPTPIDPSFEPLQEKVNDVKPIIIVKSGWDFVIRPKAHYVINGFVLSKKNYYSGVTSLISPCDIALAFGELYSTKIYETIKWSQSGRWYWWWYKENCPLKDDKWVARWSSNNHIIPENDNLKKAAKSVKKGDFVVLEGYLVDVDGEKDGRTFFWNSSMTRMDTGDGSCEVLYLKKIKINENIYY